MDDAEIIYLEADAEITDAIDKLKSAKGDAVKIVVPARSSLLQSAVNLKLLKKAAKDHGKEMALVTNDKTAQYLAGGVGLAVAASLKSEPRIPEGVKEELRPDIVEQDPEEEPTVNEGKASKASESSSKESKSSSNGKESKSMPSEVAEEAVIAKRAIGEDHDEEGAMGAEELAQKKAKAKVPNYNAFQKKLLMAAGIFAAVVVAIVLFITLPTAKLTVLAKADKLAVNSPFVIDAAATTSDPASLTYAGQKATLQKSLTQNFTATGKKDVGTKATGSVTLSNASNSDPITVPTGTVLTAGGKNFTLNSATTIPGAKLQNGKIVPGKTTGAITAVANGDTYNLGTTTFSVVGYNDSVTASGSTAGGTSKTVTVVTQADIDGAKQQAVDAAATGSKDELLAKVDKKDVVFDDTFTTTVDSVASSAPVDTEASNGTVTVKVTYAIFTATKDTMNSLLDTLAKDAMPKGDQQLYQNGLDEAQYTLVKTISDTRVQLNVATSAYYGQKIDKTQISKDTAGKSKKDVTSIVQKANPSVVSTQVESNPSLMPNMPAISSHITVIIKVSTN